jgi:putative protein kinase ArgK-like GTPase of G3E family
VVKVSSVEGVGIGGAWTAMEAFQTALAVDGRLERLRAQQSRRWFWSEVQTVLSEAILSDENLSSRAKALENAVAGGLALPYAAARALIQSFRA